MSVTKTAQQKNVIGLDKTREYLTKGRATNSGRMTGYVDLEKSMDVPMINRPTKAQRERWGRIAELGCLICNQPAEIHHAKVTLGMRKNHDLVLPLCPTHHRSGIYGEALHGTEQELLDKVSKLVDL